METSNLGPSFDVRVGNLTVQGGLGLAPMAGATNVAFRRLCKRYGAGLTITEMVSAKGLVLGNEKTQHYLLKDPCESPVGAQLFGADPAMMAEAAQRVEAAGFHLVDINMGCPVPKITDQGAGCAMMKEPQKAAAIVEAMRKKTNIPVTVKIRSGWSANERNAPEVAKVLEQAGVSALTVHARTREQKYSGQADWKLIEEVKEAVTIPVFGNGDLDNPEKAAALLRVSGCDGVTIGRAALSSPWIFRDILALRAGRSLPPQPSSREMAGLIIDLAKDLISLFGERTAVLMMRRYASDFSRGIEGGNQFRVELMKVTQLVELEFLVKKYFVNRETRAGECPEIVAGSQSL